MIDEITSLLEQTYSNQGEDINTQIQNAEQSLNDYGGSPEFCECICQIIKSDQIKQVIKDAATIYLKNMIKLHWKEDIPPESKNIILNNLPSILLKTTEQSYPNLSKLSALVIRHTFFENGEDISQLIISGFQSKENNQFLTSLILLNSISLLFSSDISEEKADLYSELTTHFLELLTEFISSTTSLFQISICFKIVNHFSTKQIPPIFESNPELLQTWFSRAMQITELAKNQTDIMFFLSSLKFISLYFYRYNRKLFPEELPLELLNCIVECIGKNTNPKILCQCTYFIKLAIKDPDTSPSILGDFEEFTKQVILPFFVLTDEDIENAANDPFKFIQDFHATSINDSDSRSNLSHAVEMQAKKSPEIIETFGSLLFSIIPLRSSEYDKITYTVCYLFSTVSKHINPKDVPSFCESMGPLLQSESFIVRSGALLALRDMKNVPAPIILSAFQILTSEEESILVKYYAAISLSSFLTYINKLSNDDQTKQIIRDEMDEETATNTIKNYFFLCQEFNDYDFISLIHACINFFGPNLHQVSPSLVFDMYNMFVEISKNEYQSDLLMQSISLYLDLLSRDSQNEILNSTIEILIGQITESLKSEVLSPKAVVTVADLTSNMIAFSPTITENHWKLMEMFIELVRISSSGENLNSDSILIYSLLLEAVCNGYKNLIIKDINVTKRVEDTTELINSAVTLICCQPYIKESGPALYLMGSLLVILSGSDIGDLSDLFDKLLPIVIECLSINLVMPYAAFCFGAMLIYNSDYLFSILQDQVHDALSAWSNSITNSIITAFLAVINKKYQAFGKDDFIMLLTRAIFLLDQLRVGNWMFENFDFDDDANEKIYMDRKKLTVFNDDDILSKFKNLLESLNNSNAEIIQQIQESFSEPIDKIVSEAVRQLCS